MDIQPKDPSKGHFYVSFANSATRIAAEVLGVVEELA